MNDPRSDEHKYPEGDMNANPTRPFYVDTDLSHYVVREQATGKSMTKRCTFDEADHACNLLNYGYRACAKQNGLRDACSAMVKKWEGVSDETINLMAESDRNELARGILGLRSALAKANP